MIRFKNILFILLMVIAGTLLKSCTEIIIIDINSSDPKLVVEATIGEGETAIVKITISINLYEREDFPAVSNTIVSISASDGSSEILTETTPGIYTGASLIGIPGLTYQLNIESGEDLITAISTMPQKVHVDTFYVQSSIYPGGGPAIFPGQREDFYEVYVKYTDPLQPGNFYRMILSLNGERINRNYISDDRLINGNQVEQLLVIFHPEKQPGDSISLEFQSIDKPVFEYFRSLSSAGNGPGNGSSPANPYTNLKGATLGYFSAHTKEHVYYIYQP